MAGVGSQSVKSTKAWAAVGRVNGWRAWGRGRGGNQGAVVAAIGKSDRGTVAGRTCDRPSSGDYSRASIRLVSCALGTAPTTWSTTRPFLRNSIVGIERI